MKTDSSLFWDYKNIDVSDEFGMTTYLNRKIMFGQFDKQDIPSIKRLFHKLQIAEYWKHYFQVYFKKYHIA